MSFYEQLGKYYDLFFPTNQKQLDFLDRGLSQGSRVLDIGCATGSYAIPMAERGHAVSAFDLDEDMIQQLCVKADHLNLNIKAWPLDMRDIESIGTESFDLIYNIGNTIVHLNDDAEITACLESCKKRVAPNGRFILQIVNYDRIVKNQISNLPILIREEGQKTFERRYVLHESTVTFIGVLSIGHETWTSESTLLCLTKNRLEQCFNLAGFSQVEFYGDFEGNAWHDESPATVAVARV